MYKTAYVPCWAHKVQLKVSTFNWIVVLEELALLEIIKKNPSVKQTELAELTGKSVRSIKRIVDSLKDKQYIRRANGKRYGKWEVLI